MPTLLNRTFALLNNIKPPSTAPQREDIEIDENKLKNETNEQETVDIIDQQDSCTFEYTPEITIWKAAEQGDLETLQYYVRHTNGVDPAILLNTRDPETNSTLLHLVISSSKNNANIEKMIKFLLENGADANCLNVYSVQAIHMVSLHCPNPLPCIKLLLDHDANPNARDGDGWTPLHYAARFCQPPDNIIKLLVERGADINLTDAGHKSPLFGLLANSDLATSLDWLIRVGRADVNILGDFFDSNYRITHKGTIVLQAAKYGRLESLSLLIRSGQVLNKLSKVISRTEIDYANRLVKVQQERLRKSSNTENIKQQLEKYDLVLEILQELEDTLLRDQNSLIYKGTNPTVAEQIPKTVQRRYFSIRLILESFRRQKKSPKKEKPTSKMIQKMSSFIKHNPGQTLESNEVTSGISR